MHITPLSLATILALGACAAAPLPDVACDGLVIERDATEAERLRVALAAGPEDQARAAVADALTGVLAAKLSATARVETPDELMALARRSGPRRIELDVLALSTGGQYGAYGSGFLTGWSETEGSPSRPSFDIVTGASAGGLIAPLAFLGRETDPLLKLNVGIGNADVIRPRPLFGLIGGSSVYTTEPLRRRVDAVLDQPLLERIREASETRRLFLGATNVTTGRFEVFGIDQYLAAKGTGPAQEECVLEALMATSAIPALFTPRSIDRQTYIDAGVRQHVFLEGIATKLAELEARSAVEVGVNLYVIVNGDLVRPAGAIAPRLIDVAARSFALVSDEGLRQSLLKTAQIAEHNGWTLRAVRAPRLQTTDSALFSPAVTNALYQAGLANGRSRRIPWLDARALRRAIED